MKATRNLIVVGDRVLIEPDERIIKLQPAFNLPATVKEKERCMAA